MAFLGKKNEAILALEIEIKERLLETRKRSDGVLQRYIGKPFKEFCFVRVNYNLHFQQSEA